MKTKGLVLAVVLIFGSASVAAAECAWVLWVRAYHQDIKYPKLSGLLWLVDSGYQTNAECAATRDSTFRDEVALVQDEPGVRDFKQNPKNAAFGYIQGGKETGQRYVCLPDTIDPREKKE